MSNINFQTDFSLENVKKTFKSFSMVSEKILYTVWKFKWLNRNALVNLVECKKELLNGTIEQLVKNNFLKINKDLDFCLIYTITNKGCKKIGLPYSRSVIKFNNLKHDQDLYKFIKAKEWKVFLGEREIIKLMGYGNYRKKRPHLPDLLVIKDNKKIAFEFELSQKSNLRYLTINFEYDKQLKENKFYDEVIWYTPLPRIKTAIDKAIESVGNDEIKCKVFKF